MRVETRGLHVRYDEAPVVVDATMHAAAGELVGLVGPNGSGKSSLLRAIHRAILPSDGRVLLDGEDLRAIRPRELAKRLAVVLQHDSPDFDFSVRETVELGRIPHARAFLRSDEDEAAIAEALDTVGASGLAERPVGELSGGERQRVVLARALAQRTPVLLLDEPTNHLDVLAQIELLELLRELPATTLIALHDLPLAAGYCDRVVVMSAGRIVAAGPPGETLTAELVERVYGVQAAPGINPLTGRPTIHLGHTVRPRRRGVDHPPRSER